MKNSLTTFVKILKYCLEASKLLTIFLALANISLGFLSTIQVWLIGKIIGMLSSTFIAFSNSASMLLLCLPYLALLIFVLIMQKLLISAIPYRRAKLLALVKRRMTNDILEAVSHLPPIYQETNEGQSRIVRAVNFINRNLAASLQSILVLISGFISMVSLLVLLGKYSIMFPLVTAVTSLPIVFIRLKQDKAMHMMYKEQFSANQLGQYYLNALTTKDSLIELLILGADSLFLDRYQAIMKANEHQRSQYFIRHALHGNLLESLLILSCNILLVIHALYLLSHFPGTYAVSMLSIIINGGIAAQENIIGFAFNGKYIAEATMYGEDFWDLIQSAPLDAPKLISSQIRTLELRDVCFHYPNQQCNQLNQINLTLHAGEIIGIVGENGSGKSTLSKVLLGLYKPSEGSILVNNAPIPKTELLFFQAGCVFQDYVRYQLTIRENIWFSMPEEFPVDKSIQQAAQAAGANNFIEELPAKYATHVGSFLENAINLSGGQWQKLAAARGFYAKGTLLVLDEPNSNMDALTEASIYRNYYEQIRKGNRIGILISHRLASTRFCDRILVLKNGSIVQDGSFPELINQDGIYKTMYEAQRQWYQKSTTHK